MNTPHVGSGLLALALLCGCQGNRSAAKVSAPEPEAVVCSLGGADLTLIDGWSCSRAKTPDGLMIEAMDLQSRLAIRLSKPLKLGPERGLTPSAFQAWFESGSEKFAKTLKDGGKALTAPLGGGMGYFVEGTNAKSDDHMNGKGMIVSGPNYVQVAYVEPFATGDALQANSARIRALLDRIRVK